MPTTTTGIATEFITFSRASNATVTDSDGKVKWAPHNLLTNSESFDAAAWTKNSTVTANNAAAPNSTTTAELVDEGTANGYKQIQQNVTTLAGVNYTLSVFAKYVSCRWLNLSLFDNGSSTQYGAASFDLLNGVVGTSGVAGTGYAIVGSPTMTPLSGSGGWYLCSVTVTNGTSVANRFAFSPSDVSTIGSSGLNTYTGTSKTFQAWGASLYRSDLAMQANTSAYPMYNPTTPKNLLGYTEDFGNAYWTKFRSSAASATNIIAPNGLQTADKLVPQSSLTQGGIYNTAITAVIGGVYTASVYAKAAELGFVFVCLNVRGSSTAQGVCVSLANGAKSNEGASGTYTVVDAGNGWWRISCTGTAANTIGYLEVYPLAAAGSLNSYTGDGTSGIYIWGAQLSDSASLDSYVPVYGAAVTSAAYYGPRRDFDPVTLACKGLLVEEQRTNLIRYSRTLETTSSYWGNVSSGTANTITIDNAPGPDGLSTSASMITYNTAVTGAGTFSLWRHSLATTANGTYTFTIWLKAGTTSSVYLRFGDNAGNRANTLCTLTSSWQRFTVTGTTTASITSISCDVGADGNAGGQTLTAGTVYAYGAQLELGGFATSYVPNGSAVAGATRLADVASVSTQAFPYSASEGTLVANCSFNTGVNVGSYFVQLGGPAAGTSYGSSNSIFRGLNQGLAAGQRLMGLTYDDTNTPSVVISAADVNVSPSKVAYGFAANNFGASVNGATVVTNTSGAVPTAATVLTLGSIRGGLGNFLNGHIRQITYLPRRISNAELVTRST